MGGDRWGDVGGLPEFDFVIKRLLQPDRAGEGEWKTVKIKNSKKEFLLNNALGMIVRGYA